MGKETHEQPILKIRNMLGKSREEMGDIIGVSRTFIWEIETGRAKLPLEHAETYAKFYQEPGASNVSSAPIIAACQWHIHTTYVVFEHVKNESTSPVEKVEKLRNCYQTMQDIQDLNVPEKIRKAAEKKAEDIEGALMRLGTWIDKEESEYEPDPMKEVTEEVTKEIAG